MSIYSANRTGSMAIENVAMNENYKPVDLARTMYESQVNDHSIFEAILANDFRELTGLREGTLLESELTALNEASAKELLASMKTRIMNFWAKIKHAFAVAVQKISAYILRDGKAYAKDFREMYKANGGKFTGSVEDAIVRTDFEVKVPTASEVEAIIRKDKNGEKMKAAEVVAAALGDYVGEKVSDTRDYSKKVAEKAFTKKNVTDSDIKGMLDTIENAATAVKELKTVEKKTADQIARIGKLLKDAERAVDAADKDAKKNASEVIRNITTLVSAYETIVSCTSRAAINCVKADVKASRSVLSKVTAKMKKDSKAQHESAVDVAEDEVDAALTDIPGEVEAVDADTQEAIDAVVATADAEVAAECGKY